MAHRASRDRRTDYGAEVRWAKRRSVCHAFSKNSAKENISGKEGSKMKRKIFSVEKCLMLAFGAILCFGISYSRAIAQEKFPTKTIKIFQGSAAGGTTDLASRMFASLLTESFGVPVISVAKIGGANTIA